MMPPLPPGLRAEADADLAHLRAQLATVQPAVLAAEGRYLQALRQPATLPGEGQAGPVDPAATRPDHRPTSLADHGVTYRPGSGRTQIAIHEYLDVGGPGYLLEQRVRWGGRIHGRLAHEAGPCAWMARDWTEGDA